MAPSQSIRALIADRAVTNIQRYTEMNASDSLFQMPHGLATNAANQDL